MKLLIAHLSDLHIASATDVLLSRGEAIGRAIASWSAEAEICILAVTGDVAYSGRKDEYDLASEFFAAVRSELARTRAELRVVQVVVPGNHDCDFSEPSQARKIALERIAEDSTLELDRTIVDLCTGPQDAYFAWNYPSMHALSAEEISSRIRWKVLLRSGDEDVAIHCYNTAWTSKYKETQGLSVASPMLSVDRTTVGVSVALFHHPYSWMAPDVGKAFRRALEEQADVILTGHEHDPDVVQRRSTVHKSHVSYFEGGLLQDSHDAESSSFNLILLDTQQRKQKWATFTWLEDHYTTGEAIEWEDFLNNPARRPSGPTLNERTRAWLADPELTLTDAQGEALRLEEFFVFPDLREVTLPGARGATLGSENLPELLAGSVGSILITGDEQSGKTSLGKMLMVHLARRGLIPVFANGKDLPKKGSRLEDYFASEFLKQYDAKSRDVFLQTDHHKRILIIDNYHEAAVLRKVRPDWFRKLSLVGRLVLLAPDVILSIEEIVRPHFGMIERYTIQPLSHVRRGRLIDHWMRRTGDGLQSEADCVRAVGEVTRTMDTLIGKNFVPAFAPYILAVLTANQASAAIDLRASTHGYFYELFIRTSLLRGRSSVQFDIVNAYLAHFAYELFQKKQVAVTLTTARAVHVQYEMKHDINRDFTSMHDSLEKQGILDTSNGGVRFRYPYIRYYFIAAYLRDHLSEPQVRAQITELARTLHVEDNANILLFLAHLSKDPFIVQQMLETARGLYAERKPCTLKDEVIAPDELEKLGRSMKQFSDGDPQKERERALKAIDDAEEFEIVSPSHGDPDNPLVRVEVMLKTIQILGQIAKNFPGSLDGETKSMIVRECCDAGFRALSSIYESVQTVREQLVQMFAGAIYLAHPSYADDRIIQRARETLVSLTSLAALGVVKRIAAAVGSADLEGTYRKALSQEVPAEQLVHLSVQLDHSGNFPTVDIRDMVEQFRTLHLASWVLRALCVAHFRTFPVPSQVKQSVCALLEVAYEQVSGAESKMLLPP